MCADVRHDLPQSAWKTTGDPRSMAGGPHFPNYLPETAQ